MSLCDFRVALVSGTKDYPKQAPFHPPELYPELRGLTSAVDGANRVYPMVRQALRLLRLDEDRFGTPEWNPLGSIIQPGQRVLIKPNFVLDRNLGGGPIEAVVTHGSVLRAIADYVLIALKGSGSLIIGDAPQMNCDWNHLAAQNGLNQLRDHLTTVAGKCGVTFSLRDFRAEQVTFYRSIVWRRKKLRDVKNGTVRVVLGKESCMEGVDSSRLYGADYGRDVTIKAQQPGRHEYMVSAEVLSADVVISVPKLKVHSKVGTTLNLKNMVGINTDKNHLAHYRIGSPADGGDEFADERWDNRIDRILCDCLLQRSWRTGKYAFLAWRGLRRVWRVFHPVAGPIIAGGNWHGNDTAWRMTLDLNRVLLTARQDGTVAESPVRRYFSIIDGIIGGQGDGPLHPTPYSSGALLAGFNPLVVDWTATRLMGFSPEAILLYANGIQQMRSWCPEIRPDSMRVICERSDWDEWLATGVPIFHFAAAPGWKGTIEHSHDMTYMESK